MAPAPGVGGYAAHRARNGRTMKLVDGEYQDRIIDIDILMIDDLVIDEPDFKVPIR